MYGRGYKLKYAEHTMIMVKSNILGAYVASSGPKSYHGDG